MDAVLVPGGFGKRGTEGKINAVTFARTRNVPYFGICFGMQMAVIEAARKAGYEAACTLPERLHEPGTFEWPRIGVYPADSSTWRSPTPAGRWRSSSSSGSASSQARRLSGATCGHGLTPAEGRKLPDCGLTPDAIHTTRRRFTQRPEPSAERGRRRSRPVRGSSG